MDGMTNFIIAGLREYEFMLQAINRVIEDGEDYFPIQGMTLSDSVSLACERIVGYRMPSAALVIGRLRIPITNEVAIAYLSGDDEKLKLIEL